MGASIDLQKAHLSRQHGDITAICSWLNDERALFLIPTFRKGAPWYIVCESAAWRYDDPAYLATQCVKACEVLGLEPSKPNWVRVATIIHETLPDLIRMPAAPLPELRNSSVGAMTLRADGQVLAQQDIRLERAEGATYG